MKRTTFINRTIAGATLCGAVLFCPFGMVQQVKAEIMQAAQSGVISGKVVDDTGEPVIGASVVVVGQKGEGTVTDIDGNFKIKVKPGTKLRFSYIGFKSEIIAAKNGMSVQMHEEGNSLNGVEVVAYGVQKKVTVTGALSSVKSEDLVRTPVGSVNNIIGGQLSGVTTVQYSGEPGSDAAKVFVRGQGTFNESEPLIQVDGVERSMNDIDPNEIESITVLKDASATAVFGIRGANGVVLITTKRGKEGKTKISATTSFSALTPTDMVDQASSWDYATFYNKMRANDDLSPLFSDTQIKKFRDGSDPIRFPNTQWADYIMKDVTLQTQHNVNISGGTKNARYFISGGMYTVGGLFKQFGTPYDYDYRYKRFNYRANLDIDVTKTTTISLNLAGNVDNSDKPYTGQGSAGMIKNMYYATPFSSPGVIDGRLVVNTTDASANSDGNGLPFIGGTGMAYFKEGFMQTNGNKLQMDLQLNQKLDFITKGLSFKVKGSYNSGYSIYKQGDATHATYQPYVQKDGTYKYMKIGDDNQNPGYSQSTSKSRDWYFESSFNYSRSFGLHNITALALYNQSDYHYFSGGAYGDVPRRYIGFVGRVTYDWNNRYMADINFGYNGSENFAPGKRFGSFPAGSIGWVASDESFFKPLKKVVSFMKLRASWGLVGNDKYSGDRFMYTSDPYAVNQQALFNRTGKDGGAYGYNFGVENGTTTYGAIESAKHNPEVTWETAFKQDYGVDIKFLRDRLSISYDYYKEHRKDILARDYTAPIMLGFTLPVSNIGSVESWGHEISVNWNDKYKDFRYWAKLNLSYNQNEVLEMKEADMKNKYQYAKGHRIGARSMYKFWKFYYPGAEEDYVKEFGVDKFPEQISKNNLKPGDAVYVDLDGDGKVDANDMTRDLGYTDDPEWMAGLSFGFAWKGFTVNAQFTGAWNVSRMISDVFRQPFYSSADSQQGGLLAYHLSHTCNPVYNEDGTVFVNQGAEYPRATWANHDQNYATSTLYEKDSKYLRLKTLQIAYDFNFPWMKALGLNQLQLSLSGYNLFTWTPYLWGDPETRASNAPSYPLQRTYTASLKIGF